MQRRIVLHPDWIARGAGHSLPSNPNNVLLIINDLYHFNEKTTCVELKRTHYPEIKDNWLNRSNPYASIPLVCIKKIIEG